MNKAKWHSGPPPSIGWWPASWNGNDGIYRWWDGDEWSHACKKDADMTTVSETVKSKPWGQGEIKWKHRPASWPERSKT